MFRFFYRAIIRQYVRIEESWFFTVQNYVDYYRNTYLLYYSMEQSPS